MVGQKELDEFRKYLETHMSNRYNVILKEKTLPMSLLNDHKKVMQALCGCLVLVSNDAQVLFDLLLWLSTAQFRILYHFTNLFIYCLIFMKQARVHLLEREPFSDAFGPKTKRKRPKLLAASYESLAKKADGSHGNHILSCPVVVRPIGFGCMVFFFVLHLDELLKNIIICAQTLYEVVLDLA